MLRPLIAALCLLAAPAAAQTAPTPAEIAEYTGLFRAAHQGDAAEIARLLAAGAEVDARDSRQRRPVHVAIFAGQPTALEALTAGADATIADREGVTPLAHARARGYAEMVALFEGAG